MYLKESDWNMYLSKNCKLESESVYCRLQVNFSGDIQSSFWPRSVLTASFLPAIVLMGWQELGLAVDRYIQMYMNIKYTYIYIPHVCKKLIYIVNIHVSSIHTTKQRLCSFVEATKQCTCTTAKIQMLILKVSEFNMFLPHLKRLGPRCRNIYI